MTLHKTLQSGEQTLGLLQWHTEHSDQNSVCSAVMLNLQQNPSLNKLEAVTLNISGFLWELNPRCVVTQRARVRAVEQSA